MLNIYLPNKIVLSDNISNKELERYFKTFIIGEISREKMYGGSLATSQILILLMEYVTHYPLLIK
jgi:hypothetical protein